MPCSLVQSTGYHLVVDVDGVEPSELAHVFCGKHEIPGAWCPNCKKPLLRFFTFDGRDQRLGLSLPQLSLLYCWTCNIAQEPFFYAMEPHGGITLLQYGEGGVDVDFPYEDYPVYFPRSEVSLVPLSEDEQQLIHRLNRGEVDPFDSSLGLSREFLYPRHQFGGEPLLVACDALEYFDLACPRCAKAMPLLATVADNCLDPRGFTGNPYVVVLYGFCADCGVLGVSQFAD